MAKKRKKIELLEVPDKNDKTYHETLLENCIRAYQVFLSDTMALDYCGVYGKQRAFILEDEIYRRRTRVIRAEAYLDEIAEIQELTEDLQGDIITEDMYDMRDSKELKNYNRDYKDVFAMRLKAAEMRRNLLSMSKREDEKEEMDAMNIFFIALTREEFLRIKEHEVQDGTESAKEALKAEKAEEGPAHARGILADVMQEENIGGYKINADGTVEDW